MKIATWNLERPKVTSNTRNQKILTVLKDLDADILILTETNSAVVPDGAYQSFVTTTLPTDNPFEGATYTKGENRVTIWSKYPLSRIIPTYNNYTSVCAECDTPFGKLAVYGTIIGTLGNRLKSFKTDLEEQLLDWQMISNKTPLCIAGDYNISFGDNFYFTIEGRERINDCFKELNIANLTVNIPQNIDHISISKSFLGSREVKIDTWNHDKKLSDHIGVSITLV